MRASVPAAKSSTISPGVASPESTTSRTRRAMCSRLGLAPVDAGLGVALLVGHEQLDRRPEGGIREAARSLERLEAVAEVGREEVIDHVEHLGPRAVVLRQREHAADLLAPLAEDLDVRVPEAVDRLELVADEEDLGVLLGEQVDQLALQPVRVLELVDHDRAEAPALALADLGVLAQELARQQLEILEVERRLAVLRLAVGAVVGEQQLLQLLAVAGGERLERGLLDRGARLLELGRAQVGEVEQLLGAIASSRGSAGRASSPARRDSQLGEPRSSSLRLRRPPRSAARARTSAASRARRSASAAAAARRTRRAAAAAPRRRRRTPRAPRGTPRRAARAPGCRRRRGSAGRSRPRTGAPSAAGGRSRGWSRSRPRRGRGPGRGGRARAAACGSGHAARRRRARCR